MSAQHVRPGRSGKRARRERALERLEKMIKESVKQPVDARWYRITAEHSATGANLTRPLRPIPPHQTRKLTR